MKTRLNFVRFWGSACSGLSNVEEMMEKLMQSDQASKQLLAMLRALEEFEDNGYKNNKTVDCLAAA